MLSTQMQFFVASNQIQQSNMSKAIETKGRSCAISSTNDQFLFLTASNGKIKITWDRNSPKILGPQPICNIPTWLGAHHYVQKGSYTSCEAACRGRLGAGMGYSWHSLCCSWFQWLTFRYILIVSFLCEAKAFQARVISSHIFTKSYLL